MSVNKGAGSALDSAIQLHGEEQSTASIQRESHDWHEGVLRLGCMIQDPWLMEASLLEASLAVGGING